MGLAAISFILFFYMTYHSGHISRGDEIVAATQQFCTRRMSVVSLPTEHTLKVRLKQALSELKLKFSNTNLVVAILTYWTTHVEHLVCIVICLVSNIIACAFFITCQELVAFFFQLDRNSKARCKRGYCGPQRCVEDASTKRSKARITL